MRRLTLVEAVQWARNVATGWVIDTNPHGDLVRGDSADHDAACDFKAAMESALAPAAPGAGGPTPFIEELRIQVSLICDLLEEGKPHDAQEELYDVEKTLEQIVEAGPTLTKEDLRLALTYATRFAEKTGGKAASSTARFRQALTIIDDPTNHPITIAS